MSDTSREDHKWPVRDAVCADCRTIASSDKACQASGKHRVYSLSDAKERAQLMTEVWGSPSLRRQAKAAGKAGATGAGAGTFFETCSGCDAALFEGETALIIGGIVLVMFVFVAGYLLIAAIIRYIHKRRQTLKPKGAIAKPARLEHATGVVGTVDSDKALPAPLSKEECVGYGLFFTCRQGWSRRSAMLRDGDTQPNARGCRHRGGGYWIPRISSNDSRATRDSPPSSLSALGDRLNERQTRTGR